MRQDHIALLSILVSVALSSLGASYFYGQLSHQVQTQGADIISLKGSDKELRELVTQIRVDIVRESSATNHKLDTLMDRLDREQK